MTYQRITTDPAQMGGQPCIRGLHIPVASVVAMVADGMTVAEILDAFPDLEAEDVSEALHNRLSAPMGPNRALLAGADRISAQGSRCGRP